MAKFRVRVKLQGFELEVDGEREDIPAITSAVQRQISGMVTPAQLANGSDPSESENPKTIDAEKKPTTRSVRRRSGSRSSEPAASPIEFRHDSSKFGNPLQTWGVAEKSIWLLYVVKEITRTAEISGPQIAATFNQYFKQAKRLHPPNVTRDLGKLKVQNPSPIGEDKNLFYLTQEGEKRAKELIQSILSPVTQ